MEKWILVNYFSCLCDDKKDAAHEAAHAAVDAANEAAHGAVGAGGPHSKIISVFIIIAQSFVKSLVSTALGVLTIKYTFLGHWPNKIKTSENESQSNCILSSSLGNSSMCLKGKSPH